MWRQQQRQISLTVTYSSKFVWLGILVFNQRHYHLITIFKCFRLHPEDHKCITLKLVFFKIAFVNYELWLDYRNPDSEAWTNDWLICSTPLITKLLEKIASWGNFNQPLDDKPTLKLLLNIDEDSVLIHIPLDLHSLSDMTFIKHRIWFNTC